VRSSKSTERCEHLGIGHARTSPLADKVRLFLKQTEEESGAVSRACCASAA